MGFSIFVTGGRGYIGSALVRTLDNVDDISRITVYDKVEGNDINNYDRLVQSMKDADPHIVIHLAAVSSVPECNDNIQGAIRTNGIGTINVMNAMKACGCNRIIYASTAAVYDKNEHVPYTETSNVKPSSVYGSTKLLSEHVIFSHFYNNDGQYVILRMFNVVGTSGYSDIDRKPSAGYDKLFNALESGHLTIYGNNYNTYDGTGVRDYVALKDVCRAYLAAIYLLMYNDNIREIMNISSGTKCSVLDLISKWNYIRNCLPRPHTFPFVTWAIGPQREGDVGVACADNNKAYKIMRWKPKKRMDDIIREIAADKEYIPLIKL